MKKNNLKKRWILNPINYSIVLILSLMVVSCATKKFIYLPVKEVPPVLMTENHYEFTIENIDENAKCDRSSLTAHYKDFSISYFIDENHTLIYEIENKNNKSLIIDKSKCFVMYDGYAVELFKNVRTGKVTTYNNVQDAINNVQTNESSVTMSIPPYSKWVIETRETNLKTLEFPKKKELTEGNYPLTPYTTEHTIEFIIPYSYDYSLAKWSTARNRLYVDNIRVEKVSYYIKNRYQRDYIYSKKEMIVRFAQEADLIEYDKVIDYNANGRLVR